MKKILCLLAVTLCLLTSALSFAQNSETLRFGVLYSYPPFVAVNPQGQSYGLDVDVAKALCQDIHKNCVFIPMPFADLFTALDNGTIDAAMSALVISPQRKDKYDFIPYYQGNMSFLTLASSKITPTPEGMRGKTAGTMKDTSFVGYLKTNFPNTTVKEYDLVSDVIAALSSGEVDIFLTDGLNAKYWVLNGNNQYKIVGSTLPLPGGAYYGIAIKKGNTEMLNLLSQALQANITDGTLSKIYNIYLKF